MTGLEYYLRGYDDEDKKKFMVERANEAIEYGIQLILQGKDKLGKFWIDLGLNMKDKIYIN